MNENIIHIIHFNEAGFNTGFLNIYLPVFIDECKITRFNKLVTFINADYLNRDENFKRLLAFLTEKYTNAQEKKDERNMKRYNRFAESIMKKGIFDNGNTL